MPVEITMPRLSDTMEQGTVVKWNVKEGDSVSPGDVLADIETDKATMELESFDEGTVAKIAAEEGQSIAVGQVIMVLAEEGEDVDEAASSAGTGQGKSQGKERKKSEGKDEDSESAISTATKEADRSEQGADSRQDTTSDGASNDRASRDRVSRDRVSSNGSRIFASPLARKLASENNIDLSQVRGTGPSGRIIRKDVDAAMARGGEARAEPSRAEPEPSEAASAVEAAVSTAGPTPSFLRDSPGGLSDQTVPLSNMRATIAKRLVESKQTVPHYQVTVSARLDNLLALRKQLNEQLESQGVKLSVNDFLVRACALAMHEHPFVNSSWSEQGGKDGGPAIKVHGRVNIGVAVALPMERGGGLVVATLRDADRRGLRDLSEETKHLARKAREKGLTIEEMSDSTFTISNLGMFGVDHFTAIINPPNVAILAVGRAIEKPFVATDDDGDLSFEIGQEMAMTMSSDHRVVDGAMAAQYLNSVKQLLESPASLLV